MSLVDIFLWPDAFWCYREEYCPEMGRDIGYRVLLRQSDEWMTHSIEFQPDEKGDRPGEGSRPGEIGRKKAIGVDEGIDGQNISH